MVEQGDPIEFLGWILNTLHRDLGGGKKRDSSMIYRAFQGELRLETQAVIVKDELSGHLDSVRPEFDISRGEFLESAFYVY
jgi:U4/U6.U5 tri-snRNP-associated protein 2